MRNVTLTTITIAITVAFTLHATEAWTCSPGEVGGVSLSDGAVDVPTNASLFFGMSDIPSNATLVDEASGERTELQINFESPFSEVALPGLAPSRAYRVELDAFDDDGDGVLAPNRTLRFTTAAGADDEAPAVDDVDSSVSSEKIAGGLTFGEGCALSPLPYWREDRVQSNVTFDVEVSPDTVLVRLFRLSDEGRLDRGVTFTNGATSLQIEDVTSDEGDVTYRVVAVDAAGNTSNQDVDVSLATRAGGCSQVNASSTLPIVAALILLRGRRRISRRIARRIA